MSEVDYILRHYVCACGIDRWLSSGRYGQACPLHSALAAKAIEARRAATGNTDAVADESAVPKGFAQKGQP